MMKRKQIVKIIVDVLMTVVLLLLMAYSLVGEAVHECLGIGMFVLFLLHHVLNRNWNRNLLKGRHTQLRTLQTVLVVLALVTMAGSMISGMVLSRHVLSFLPITGGQALARTLHMLSAYWGLAIISLHLGLHFNIMLGMVRKVFGSTSGIRRWIIRGIGVLIAGYGIYAFIKRDIGSYMFYRSMFVFFDYEEPIIFFLLDYVAVMGLFVFIGHYFAEAFKRE